jgi:hypothetical protein
MSILSNFKSFKDANTTSSVAPIGEIVSVICRKDSIANNILSNTYVKANNVYLQADYPLLFQQIGLIEISPTYNTSTQFYVPEITSAKITLNFTPSVGYSDAQIVSYVKAKNTTLNPLAKYVKSVSHRTNETPSSTIVLNSGETLIKTNSVYFQAEYTSLFSQLGLINANTNPAAPNYDANTQFFVPNIVEHTTSGQTGSPTITTSTYILAKNS